jgi:hypothetical protein
VLSDQRSRRPSPWGLAFTQFVQIPFWTLWRMAAVRRGDYIAKMRVARCRRLPIESCGEELLLTTALRRRMGCRRVSQAFVARL